MWNCNEGESNINFIHTFGSKVTLGKDLKTLKNSLHGGMIWFPGIKSAKIPTDVTEDIVRDYALTNGLVDIKVCAIDELCRPWNSWSGKRQKDDYKMILIPCLTFIHFPIHAPSKSFSRNSTSEGIDRWEQSFLGRQANSIYKLSFGPGYSGCQVSKYVENTTFELTMIESDKDGVTK